MRIVSGKGALQLIVARPARWGPADAHFGFWHSVPQSDRPRFVGPTRAGLLLGKASETGADITWGAEYVLSSLNPVAPTILLASLFCGSFWGLTWFNRKVQFSLLIVQLVTTFFAVVTCEIKSCCLFGMANLERTTIWTICRIPVRPFDKIVKAGNSARPKTGADRVQSRF